MTLVPSSPLASLPTVDVQADAVALVSPAAATINAALQSLEADMGKTIADGQAENARLIQRIKELETQRDDASANAVNARTDAKESLGRLQEIANIVHTAQVTLGLGSPDRPVILENILLELNTITSLAIALHRQADADTAIPTEGGPARLKKCLRPSVLSTFEARLIDGDKALKAVRAREKAMSVQLVAAEKKVDEYKLSESCFLRDTELAHEETTAAILARDVLQAELDATRSALANEQAASQSLRSQVALTSTKLKRLEDAEEAYEKSAALIKPHLDAGNNGTLPMSNLARKIYFPMTEYIEDVEKKWENKVAGLTSQLTTARLECNTVKHKLKDALATSAKRLQQLKAASVDPVANGTS